jgi:hypothetical protein
MSATVTNVSIFDMQVCVPADWTDAQVEEFANSQNPAGTELGWRIRGPESPYQQGAPVRVQCAIGGGNVHIMLEC